MVAFDRPLHLAYDAITFRDEAIWFFARTQSKPGLEASGAPGGAECWTLVSTPGLAVAEISAVPMQDAKTGAFKPQEDGYLNTGPAPALLEAFQRHAARLQREGADAAGRRQRRPAARAEILYLQGQRWSALPACAAHHGRDQSGAGPTTSTVCGVRYEPELLPLVYTGRMAVATRATSSRMIARPVLRGRLLLPPMPRLRDGSALCVGRRRAHLERFLRGAPRC